MMRNALRTGFTLVELLVTLILLGLLTAIVFPIVVQQITIAIIKSFTILFIFPPVVLNLFCKLPNVSSVLSDLSVTL